MLSASRYLSRRRSAEGADGDLEIAQRVALRDRCHSGCFHEGRPLEPGASTELPAAVDRRVVPPAVEPHRPPTRRAQAAAFGRLECDEAVERYRPAPPDDRGAQAHDL